RVYGDAVGGVVAVSAEIGRIRERRARSVQLGHESIIYTTPTGGLEGTCGWEISRSRRSRDISVSGRIYGDTSGDVVAAPPEIGRIQEHQARSVQLGHESIRRTPDSSLEGTCGREISRGRTSSHVSVSGRSYGKT